MIAHEYNTETFEHWMKVEKMYAQQEYQWAYKIPVDYTRAAECHRLRWRAMDLALDSWQRGLVADPLLRIPRA